VDNVLGSHFSKTTTNTSSSTPTSTSAPTPTSSATSDSTAPTTTSPGTRIGPTSAIEVGDALAFTDQTQGIPAYCVHKSAGEFVAFSAICTHAGCTVGFDHATTEFVCPCHGSIYNALTGAVINGPAPLPLPTIHVEVTNGTLYSTD
jgi:thiosulfate dehydrogenase [quinone] large subunit